MAIRTDPYDGSVVIDGFEKGIADSPYDGIADEKNVNIITIPGEASVNYKTVASTITLASTYAISGSDSTADTITFSNPGVLEGGMAITFSTTPSIGGISQNTVYWLGGLSGSTCSLYANYALTGASKVDITGATATATAEAINMDKPMQMTADGSGHYYCLDKSGRLWSNLFGTSVSSYWTYTGNTPPSAGATNGNGLVTYQVVDSTGNSINQWVFVFHNSSIDYMAIGAPYTWVYQWDPVAGTSAGWASTPTRKLKAGVGLATSHEALVSPDNIMYFCDTNWIGKIYQRSPTIAFDPTNTATYTFAQFQILPYTDTAQCLAVLGNNLMIGGIQNVIYPWDTTSTKFQYPMFIAESNISKMVTVNTNTFIFAGNRGRIYITNGSQANLYKKVPDHISGTIEPYFTWGAVGSFKNQLYFSAIVTTNSSGNTELPYYGGMWAIDMDTKGMRLVNKLSYGTYAGYANTFVPIIAKPPYSQGNPPGTGYFCGWQSALQDATYGIDATSQYPYSNSVAVIESDLIPIGTWQKPRQLQQVEYRLSKPMVSGESIVIKYRLDFSQSWTALLSDATVGNFSNSAFCAFDNAQWLQFQITLNSTNTTPSYTRLREIRVTGIKE